MGKLIVNKKILKDIFRIALIYILAPFVLILLPFIWVFFCDMACHIASSPRAYRELNEVQQLYMQSESWSQFKQLMYDNGFDIRDYAWGFEDKRESGVLWWYTFYQVDTPDTEDYIASLFNMPSVLFRYPRHLWVTVDQNKDKIVDIKVSYQEIR